MLLRCAPQLDLKLSPNATYDEVLEALLKTELEFGEFSNHGPMVADALVASGKPERVASWVEQYGKDLLLRQPAAALPAEQRAAALGIWDRRAEWIAAYEEELLTIAPRELIAREWAKLGPGLVGALWHGVIRSGHAMRGLEREDNEVRRKELAQGLGYWAAKHQQLPGVPGARAVSGLDVTQALSAVPRVPEAERKTGVVVERELDVLEGRADFVDAVEAVDLDALPVEEALTQLVTAASRLFVNQGKRSIKLLHAITGTSVLRLIFPSLDAAQQRQAIGFAFQAVAAAHAAWSGAKSWDAIAAPTRTMESLIAQAASSDDAHHIKLGEAARRESHPEVTKALEHWLS
jgi:hypothetical protein